MRVQPVLLCLVLVSVSFAFKDNRQKRGVEKSEKIRAHEFLDQESAKLVHGKFVPRICGLIRFRGCATLRSAALKPKATSSPHLGKMREKKGMELSKRMRKGHKSHSAQQQSTIAFGCICGFISFKCCERKRSPNWEADVAHEGMNKMMAN